MQKNEKIFGVSKNGNMRLATINKLRTNFDILPTKIQEEIKKYVYKEPWVTPPHISYVTMTFDCLRKAYFVRTIPKPPTDDSFWYFCRGKFIDELFCGAYPEEHQQIKVRKYVPMSELDEIVPGTKDKLLKILKQDFPDYYETVKEHGENISINGRADFYDADTNILYELKTINSMWLPMSLGGGPRLDPVDKHEKQVLFYYKYLLEDPNNEFESFDEVRVLYVTMDGIHPIKLKFTDEDVQQIDDFITNRSKRLIACLVNKIPPQAERSWLCPSCEYNKECKKADLEEKKQKEAKLINSLKRG